VEFEQMRFSDKFDFHLEIDEAVDMDRIMVQPLTIQPFAENAIWHGLMPLQRKGNLHISVSVWGNILKVIITDDGIGRKQAAEFEQNALIEKESMGLKIMTERMKIMESISGKSTGFRIEDLSDEHRNACGTRVTIELET
jgi:LytS/YehU family sensor histidine kinase